EWVHVQLHQQKGMISLSPPTICNSAEKTIFSGITAFVVVENGVIRQSASDKAVANYGLTDTLPVLIERFNAGERYR
ncbi:hypothetical protein OCZ64_09500, partial [Proteus mirabilis]|nr:hypothetical protein [Proteus mirabilis]